MSWNSSKNSYIINKPHLSEIIGDEFSNALLIYHKWCNQILTIRLTSIAFIFFAFGVFGIYLINLPIYLFGLISFKYISFSGLWNVICMVSILTIHLYFNSLHFNILNTNTNQTHIQNRLWSIMFPLISYPFCALCFSSFYLQWLEIPFLSSNSSANNNNNNTIFQYSIFILSYIYGYIPYQLINYNKIHFKSMQINRTLFFKQLLRKIFVSNSIQSITYCICILICFYNQITNIFYILFIVTFNINFLYILGYNIMNRLLTEKIKYPSVHNNNLNIKNNRHNIDIKLFSLTRTYNVQIHNENPNQTELFYYLSLISLLDVVRFHSVKRKNIYAKQTYFNVIIDTLLYDYTQFIIKIYQCIYGQEYKALNSKYNNAFFNKFYLKYWILKPNINKIFNNYNKLIYSADILSYLIIHSLEEDELGIVQESLDKILCILLECLDILDLFVKSDVYCSIYGYDSKGVKNENINHIYKGVETAVIRVTMKMYNYLEVLKLPKKNAFRLQSYLDRM